MALDTVTHMMMYRYFDWRDFYPKIWRIYIRV